MESRFKLFGFILLGGLVVWIGYSLATIPFLSQAPEVEGPKVMGSSPEMPDAAMEATIKDASGVMKANYQSAHRYRWSSRCADWIGFLLTAAITVLVGSTGQALQGTSATPPQPLPPGTIPAEAAALGRKWMRRIGVMAALASVMIGISSRLASSSQERLEWAEQLRGAVTNARIKYAAAATPIEGQAVIDDLASEVEKYR